MNTPIPPPDDSIDISHNGFVYSLRRAAPYIGAHRDSTFVLVLGGEIMAEGGGSIERLARDIALLASLGVRLVLVHGARPQIEAKLAAKSASIEYHHGLRVTNDDALACVLEAAGTVRVLLEARLSSGLTIAGLTTPGASQRRSLRIASGNLITAQPLGVREGIDYQHSGEVRKVDTTAINARLDAGEVVLLSPLGYSPTGEVFNVAAEDIAVATAIALKADKLAFLSESGCLTDEEGHSLPQLGPGDVERHLERLDSSSELSQQLQRAVTASTSGVKRVHIVPRRRDGGLLLEFFTRDGIGNLITADAYDAIRGANIDDVGGILQLIAPLEEQGVLVRRSREQLELEIEYFSVLERDGLVIGCAALYPYPDDKIAELACVAISEDYKGENRGDWLLTRLEQQAKQQGIEQLFVLTTRTGQWFQQRGFKPADVEALPVKKQAMYNLQRNSKVFVKTLAIVE